MTSEIGFLLDLFLADNLPKEIQKMISERIKELTALPAPPPIMISRTSSPGVGVQQSPSMQRIIEAHPDVPMVAPATPAAAQALQARAQLIQNGMKEKPEPGRTSPRKF